MSSQSLLPASGPASFDLLARVIQAAPATLGVPDEIEVRSVLVGTEARYFNIETVMRVGYHADDSLPEEQIHYAGSLALTAKRFRASSVKTEGDLRSYLAAWVSLVNSASTIDFQDFPHCSREPSHNAWDEEPLWFLSVYDKSSKQKPNTPVGPFYDARTRFLAESVRAATFQWLGTPSTRGVDSVADEYQIIVRDPRVMIWSKELTISERELGTAHLVLNISSHVRSIGFLDVAVIETAYDGSQRRKTHPLLSNPLRAPLKLPIRDLDVWVLSQDTGEWFDRFRDSEQSQHGISLLAPRRTTTEPGYSALVDALERGECDTVEFKAFLPYERKNSKSIELLRTVSAFANSRGGSLFVGVNDDAEVLGVSSADLKGIRAKSAVDSDLRAAYADRIRKIVSEGIDPPVTVGIDWIEHAGFHILRINVPASAAAPHQLVESGDYFERRGASCKRGLPERFIRRP